MGVSRAWHLERGAFGALLGAISSAGCSVLFDVEWMSKGCPEGQVAAAGPGCVEASMPPQDDARDGVSEDGPIDVASNEPDADAAGGPDADAAVNPDAEGGLTDGLACVIGTGTAQAPYGVGPVTISDATLATIEAENYDIGGEGISYHDTTPCNTLGRLRTGPNEGVDIEQTCGTTCADIAAIDAMEWTEYTVNVTKAGMYSVTLGDAALNPSQLHLEIDGNNVSGALLVPSTGGPTRFVNNVTGVAIALPQGQHVLRVVFDTGGMALNWIKLTYAPFFDAGSTDARVSDAPGG